MTSHRWHLAPSRGVMSAWEHAPPSVLVPSSNTASTIGDDTIVGANSYVNHDVESLVVAYGSPASVVRSRKSSDPYLM